MYIIGFTYPVKQLFLEDVLRLTSHHLKSPNSPNNHPNNPNNHLYRRHLSHHSNPDSPDSPDDPVTLSLMTQLSDIKNNNISIYNYIINNFIYNEYFNPKDINYNLIIDLIIYIHQTYPVYSKGSENNSEGSENRNKEPGAILVFLPGWGI